MATRNRNIIHPSVRPLHSILSGCFDDDDEEDDDDDEEEDDDDEELNSNVELLSFYVLFVYPLSINYDYRTLLIKNYRITVHHHDDDDGLLMIITYISSLCTFQCNLDLTLRFFLCIFAL